MRRGEARRSAEPLAVRASGARRVVIISVVIRAAMHAVPLHDKNAGAQPRAGGGVESCAGEVLLWGAVCLAPAAEEPTAGKEEPVGLQSEPGVRRDSPAVEKIVL